MEYELYSHEAYLAGEHGNFARALARAAAAADGDDGKEEDVS